MIMSELINNKKKRKRVDRLSNLPEELIHHILSFMNIKFAVQTCILSNKWTSLWTRLPSLNLNTDIFESLESFKDFLLYLFIHYDTSKLHSCWFDCKTDEWDSALVGAIIGFALKNKVKDLIIRCPISTHNERFETPSQVFTCPSLERLSLSYVSIPESVKSFSSSSLTYLHLYQVLIESGDELQLSCENLKNCVMMDCVLYCHIEFVICSIELENLMVSYDVLQAEEPPIGAQIKISAPSLVSFELSTLFDYDLIISLDRCPALVSVEIDLTVCSSKGVDVLRRRTYAMHLINFLKELTAIKYLTLSADTLEALSEFPDLMKNMSSPFHNLKALNLDSCLQSQSISIPPEVKAFLFSSPRISMEILK